jgi:hypothetical protein
MKSLNYSIRNKTCQRIKNRLYDLLSNNVINIVMFTLINGHRNGINSLLIKRRINDEITNQIKNAKPFVSNN